MHRPAQYLHIELAGFENRERYLQDVDVSQAVMNRCKTISGNIIKNRTEKIMKEVCSRTVQHMVETHWPCCVQVTSGHWLSVVYSALRRWQCDRLLGRRCEDATNICRELW